MTISIEQAAALAGLPVTSKSLVSRDVCECCDERFTVRDEPPYDVCRMSPTGDFECDAMLELTTFSEFACELAAVIARYHKAEVRKAVAESVYDGLDDVLGDMHGRPALDEGEFMRLCGVTS